MEIIHVVPGKPNPSSTNGVNRVVNELATQQINNGEKVRLWGITRYPRHDYPGRCYPTHLFRAAKHAFQLDKTLLQAIDALDKDTVVLHLHGGFIPAFYTLSKALRERGVPYVLTPHGSYNTIALQRSAWRKKLYFRFFERQVLDYARAIHCLGKSEVAGLRRLWPNGKTVLIPHGFQLPERGEFPDSSNFIIGFCGRLDTCTKGLDILLRGFALFLQLVPTAELRIIGDGPDRRSLEDLAADLKIRDNIIFYGNRFDEEKRSLLQQLHAFAHPSRNEGLPTALLEAASLGIPCIVTEATDMADAIRCYECGEVAAPYTASISRALMRLYRKITLGQQRALSDNARNMVKAVFNWEHIVADLRQLYLRA